MRRHARPASPSSAARHEAQRLLTRGLLALLLCYAGGVHALDPGTASGSLDIAGLSLQLTTSSALDYRDRAGLAALAEDGPALRIALAATPLAPDALEGPGHQQLRANIAADGTPVVLLRVPRDPIGPQRGARLFVLGPTQQPLASFDVDDLAVARSGQRVLGAFDVASPDGRVRVRARFSAPVFDDRAPDVALTGEAARASPQAAVLLVFEQALRQGAFERARALATAARRRPLALLEQRDEGDVSMLVAGLPSPQARRLSISRLVQVGRLAWLVSEGFDARLIPLRQTDGRWRVDAP